MSVTDFECAIAKSQIGRYIGGENLAPEIARQLESHINNCSRCKQLLQERKNSLVAMITNGEDSIRIESDAVPMTSGSNALKPDYMEVLADSARKSLRDKLAESTRIKTETVEVPAVASAFAYKDAKETETIKLQIEAPEEPTKKRGFSLSSLALFREVPEDTVRPAMTMDNIRAAKAVIRDNNPSMKKPVMYLAGLCAVVAAMSFVLRDPTTLFGGKAESFAKTKPSNKIVGPINKPATKVAKVLPHKTTQLNDKGTDAQSFTTKSAPKPKKLIQATKPSQKGMIAKVQVAQKAKPSVKKATPKLAHHAVTLHAKTKTQAQRFTSSSKHVARHKAPVIKRKAKSQPEENTVKLYTPETTPQSQEKK